MADFGGVGTGRKSENQKSRNRRKQANNTTNTLSLSLSLRTAVTSPLLGQIGLLGKLVAEMAFLGGFGQSLIDVSALFGRTLNIGETWPYLSILSVKSNELTVSHSITGVNRANRVNRFSVLVA